MTSQEFTTNKKIIIVSAILVSGLLSFAVGIAAKLFVAPMFYVYLAIAGAVALEIGAITMVLLKKRKVENSIITNKKAGDNRKLSPNSFIANTSATWKMASKNKKTVNEPILPAITMQQSTAPNIEAPAQNIETPTAHKIGGKITCSACKKEFTTPIYLMSYSESGEKKVSYCPYCDHIVD